MKQYFAVAVEACLCIEVLAVEPPQPISDNALLSYASALYDKSHIEKQRTFLGQLNGTPVVADFICSDLCPTYAVRVIHYELGKDQSCAAAGGIEKAIRVPVSIAAMDKVFCFPKVLTDNWEKYQK